MSHLSKYWSPFYKHLLNQEGLPFFTIHQHHWSMEVHFLIYDRMLKMVLSTIKWGGRGFRGFKTIILMFTQMSKALKYDHYRKFLPKFWKRADGELRESWWRADGELWKTYSFSGSASPLSSAYVSYKKCMQYKSLFINMGGQSLFSLAVIGLM